MTESDEEEDHTRNDEGTAVFSSSWLPGSDSKYGLSDISLFLSDTCSSIYVLFFVCLLN